MRAYNLHFQSANAHAVPPKDAIEIGWLGTNGPAIDASLWPRGTKTGLPMMHAFTIRLPEEYQRQGPEYPGIAFFQGEDQFATAFEREEGDPFVQQLNASRDHPMLQRREDYTEGQFGFIWLTEAELRGGPTAPPRDVRRQGKHCNDNEGPNAWDNPVAHGLVYRSDRNDPNAGKAPTEPEVDGYLSPDDLDGPAQPFTEWAAELSQADGHIGGTAFPAQGMPDGLTSFYLEFWDFEELNFGGGLCQLDLESDTFDWACS